jgi:hypothetical protein
MAASGTVIPQSVVDIKMILGMAIFRETFWNVHEVEPPLGELRSLSRANILNDANRWLNKRSQPLSELHQVARRALEALPNGLDAAVNSFNSGTINDFPAVIEMINGSPMGCLSDLVVTAIDDEKRFRRVMEFFRDLSA